MQIMPMIILFIFSGWAVDNFPRKTILISCAFVEAAVYIGLAVTMNSGEFNRLIIFSLIFLHGCARAFYSPASQAILPNIVSSEFLSRAVAITSSVWTTAQTIGPFAAGLLIALIDFKTYWAMVALSITGACFFVLLPKLPANKPLGRGLKPLLRGVRYVMENPYTTLFRSNPSYCQAFRLIC